MLVVNASPGGSKSFTDFRALSANVPSADTSQNCSATTNDGCVVSQHNPTARKYLVVSPRTTSPFINAQLINTETNLIETLTVSGALSGALAGAFNYTMTYSDEQSAWYLAAANAVYPLTLAGTTLTVGSSFTGPSQGSMTGDKTDLYWLDNSSTDVFTHYDLSGASSNVLTPPLTYLTAGFPSNRKASRIHYSNGKIYMIGSYKTDEIDEFQVYDIAGDSWTRLPLPPTFQGAIEDHIMITDPDDNTYVYLYYGGDSKLARQPQMMRFNTADEAWEFYSHGVPANGMVRDDTADTNRSFAAIYAGEDSMSSGAADISNGDIIMVGDLGSTYDGTPADVMNWGDNQAATIFEHTGSGEFLGASSPYTSEWSTSTTSAGPAVNANVTLKLTIDGSTERIINLAGLDPRLSASFFSVKFATSLKIEVLPCAAVGDADTGQGLQVHCFVGITS